METSALGEGSQLLQGILKKTVARQVPGISNFIKQLKVPFGAKVFFENLLYVWLQSLNWLIQFSGMWGTHCLETKFPEKRRLMTPKAKLQVYVNSSKSRIYTTCLGEYALQHKLMATLHFYIKHMKRKKMKALKQMSRLLVTRRRLPN